MKKIENFENVYESIKNNNEEKITSIFEKAKLETKKRNKFTLITCLILDIIVFIFIFSKFNSLMTHVPIIFKIVQILLPLFILDLFVYVIYTVIFNKHTQQYSLMFKNLVIKDLLSHFYTDLNYLPQNQISKNIYNEGQYNEYYNRYYSDDYLKAKIDATYDIEMAEVKTQKVETRRDSKGRTHTTTTTIFNGIFAKITLDKSIKTTLKIRRNATLFSKNRLNMDSQEFEKYFDVSTDNQIIGMQLLTADVMEKLVDFYTNSGIQYDISIINNILYLRFHCDRMFEIGSFKDNSIPIDTLNKYYNILKFINELTNELLNTINITEV